MTWCASPLSNFPPEGERAIASSPASGRGLRIGEATGAGQRSFGAGSCAQRVMPEPMTASHLLPQSAGFAITSDLASVVCAPSRMASCFASNVPARGRPMGSPLLRSDPFALSEVQP
jgi:hypothetical protein